MFTLILGPMKSGKSFELAARIAPYEYTYQRVLCVQPKANTRDEGIRSRLGTNVTAIKVESLSEVKQPFDVIAVDEVHMFGQKDEKIIEKWLHQDKNVMVTGLDLDYRGKMPPIIKKLLELKPDEVVSKVSVCDVCRQYRAQFTQILNNGRAVKSGLPTITIDDGNYEFQARCRGCFEKA